MPPFPPKCGLTQKRKFFRDNQPSSLLQFAFAVGFGPAESVTGLLALQRFYGSRKKTAKVLPVIRLSGRLLIFDRIFQLHQQKERTDQCAEMLRSRVITRTTEVFAEPKIRPSLGQDPF